jgi:selenocysteine lyase/cysteine desulfurase
MKRFFPTLNKYSNYIFCNNASNSQLPEHVLNANHHFLINNYVEPETNNILSKSLTAHIKEAKKIVNIIFNNKHGHIVYGGSCTQLIYNLANSMEKYLKIKNGEIILADFNHESCITPFERIATKNNAILRYWSLNKDDPDNKYKICYDDLLKNINCNTSLVVLPHVSNILGNVLDIYYLNKEIKKINPDTKLLVDGVSLMPHGLINVDYFGCDFYVVSFYKFCGLRISALYIKDSDFIYNIENQNHNVFDNGEEFTKKLEIGDINYENMNSIIGLKEYFLEIARFFNYNNSKVSNDFLEFNRKSFEFVIEKIKIYERVFVNMFKVFLNNNPNIEIMETNDLPKVPIFSLLFKDYDLKYVSLILNEIGVLTNNSTFYCNRLFDYYKLNKENGTFRISLMHYNGFDEGNKLIDYLKIFKKIDSNFYYRVDSNYKNRVCSELKDSFNYLNRDMYYEDKRMRAFSLLKIINVNNIEIIGNLQYYCSSKYNNNNGIIIRKYSNIESSILNNKCFKFLLYTFYNELKNHYNEININYIKVHQIRVYVSNNKSELNNLGIHQEGYNAIGIACINRTNIKGGINLIYDSSKKLVHGLQLDEGEMLILNDNKLYHDILPIELYNDELDEGYRDILVFTSVS